jgi:hypothetical protein
LNLNWALTNNLPGTDAHAVQMVATNLRQHTMPRMRLQATMFSIDLDAVNVHQRIYLEFARSSPHRRMHPYFSGPPGKSAT